MQAPVDYPNTPDASQDRDDDLPLDGHYRSMLLSQLAAERDALLNSDDASATSETRAPGTETGPDQNDAVSASPVKRLIRTFF